MVLCLEDETTKGPIRVSREDGAYGMYGVNLEWVGEVQDNIRTCSDTINDVLRHAWLANDLITPCNSRSKPSKIRRA